MFVSYICHMSCKLRILRWELQVNLTFEQELSVAVVPEEIMPLQLNLFLFLDTQYRSITVHFSLYTFRSPKGTLSSFCIHLR